ncbi:MAG: NifB/NifX family molybdenum-iron cluster-binding protein [Lentisphaeria bacterium]|jgi:predicted Fe-Mo cluster-binding NifX family protein
MKIAITATGPNLEANVDPRFGRCPYFLVIETDDLSFEAIENPNLALGGGAGIQSAQLMADKGVKHVLTGNCGPNAHQTLAAASIAVAVGCSGPIRQVIEQFKAGRFTAALRPNVAGHFGMGAAPADTPGEPTQSAPAFGAGMGRGGGRGMGRGMGMGMGRGMGGGMGRGRGMGLGRGVVSDAPPAVAAGGDELSALKQEAEAMGQQMRQIQQRIAELEQEKNNGENRPRHAPEAAS